MGKRRRARENALQVLFELEFNEADLDAVLDGYWKSKRADEQVRGYADWLVRGIVARKAEVDELIQGMSRHWRISRMACVDRNILRIAVFELLEEKLIAPAIIINEAIEIAKRYSSDEAALFVNGVLDAVRKKLRKSEAKQEGLETKAHERPKQTSSKRILGAAGRSQKK